MKSAIALVLLGYTGIAVADAWLSVELPTAVPISAGRAGRVGGL